MLTAINNTMVINKKASKKWKHFVSFTPIIYAIIRLRKIVDNICYFHEKQP